MKRFIGFTKIGQYRNIIRDACHVPEGEVFKEFATLTFTGTIKLHGTNAGISHSTEGGIWYQSRKNIITPTKDNAGFAFAMTNIEGYWITKMKELNKEGYITSIFGEWVGRGIQRGVAVSELDKRFIVFAIKYTNIEDESDHFYIRPDFRNEELDVYNILDFPTYTLDIDFNHPEKAQVKMIELVNEVEAECPFGKHFGVSGVGEGIVWTHYDEDNKRVHIFKTKGEKHSVSKVKTLASVDVEKVKSIDAFVEYTVTENRLNQGIEQVFTISNEEPRIQMMKDFLSWVSRDIITEEQDTLVENGLEPKDIGRALSKKARVWFVEYLDNLDNLYSK